MLARRPLATAATALTAALLALTALSGCATAGGALAGAEGAGADATSSAVADSVADGDRVAVIGDSIESGLGLEPSEAWPALVAASRGWRLDNLSVPGAGFVAVGSDGNDFTAQVDAAIATRAQLVFIGASDNDLGSDVSDVSAAMQKAVERLSTALPDARIVGFSALSGQASDADLAPFDTALRKAVEKAGGTWLDLGQPYRGQGGLVQDDDEHPTLPGQQVIAAVVESKLGA
ncbi:SGNH/GDSL hydrolase family protein [Leifsonia sp. 2MCAF36]|uniref:SGNH/GDSL hydrolase family protein n=1 Tax=Leifsonia sp. 2MCAF36 TaxID=3232988 RepID=UPI003F9AB3DC